MRTLQHSLHRQSGMVLIISLFVLLLLTIIGVSGMKVTGLEETMAGNDRDQGLAFQAAETALRIGEAQAKNFYSTNQLGSFCDGTLDNTATQQGLFYNASIIDTVGTGTINDGRCLPCLTVQTAPSVADCAIPNPMTSSAWDPTLNNSVQVPSANLLANTTAAYFITYHYYYRKLVNPSPAQYSCYYYFTITARGAGASGGESVLRSYFGGSLDCS